MTADGKANKKFSHFGDTLQVGHWHNDMPGLTDDAKIPASRDALGRSSNTQIWSTDSSATWSSPAT